MRYSALIHHLLRASEEAKRENADVAERLQERCVDGINIIRETLMNAVCDPRFKMHVDVIPGWQRRAQQHLESFAERLQNIPNLDETRAYNEMDEMLDRWLTLATTIAEEYDKTNFAYTDIPKDKNDKHYQYIKEILERYVNDEEEKLYKTEEEDELDDLLSKLSWDDGKESEQEGSGNGDSGEEQEDQPGKGEKDDNEDENSEGTGDDDKDENSEAEGEKDGDSEGDNEEDEIPNMFSNGNSPGPFGYAGGHGQTIELENRFLSNVPASLIELAKRIGRSGENVYESSSSFTTSSKSDIAGITTGDDLSSLLPTELAMLSEPATRDIFYHNFVTKRLQVFASASQGKTGKKKHDGPIIICLDTSGSMMGEPVLVAKALALAICIIAQRRKRKVLVVKYSCSHDLFRLHNIERDKKPLLSFLGEAEMGGNDENEMFRWLFDEIMPHEGDYSTADILCISDFGWAPICEEVFEKIKAEKQKGMTFYGLNIGSSEIGGFPFSSDIFGDYPGTPDTVCDSLWEYKDGVCKETKKKSDG